MEIEYEEYLQHHGVDGQKWGVQNGPPYPLDSQGRKALREARKKEREERKQQRKSEKAAVKKQKQRTKNLKKARKARAKKREEAKKKEEEQKRKEAANQKKKDKLLSDPQPGKIFKNRNLGFSQEEIDSFTKRFEWQQKIDNYSTTRMENMSKKAASLTKMMNSGVTGYNTVAAVWNAWFPDEKTLPIIQFPKKDK